MGNQLRQLKEESGALFATPERWLEYILVDEYDWFQIYYNCLPGHKQKALTRIVFFKIFNHKTIAKRWLEKLKWDKNQIKSRKEAIELTLDDVDLNEAAWVTYDEA